MKNLVLAALAVLSLGATVVPAFASTVAADAAATRIQQTGAYGQQ